ncbi:hypothetical protein ASB65_21430 [Agrobacterium tumefaciens str. B6]|nr:hypothetical protein ASB65_21430 [Agrobacterium tumefaciens str. B6]MQB27682.1 hypothetical protein [Agrobacterium tumefaciens]
MDRGEGDKDAMDQAFRHPVLSNHQARDGKDRGRNQTMAARSCSSSDPVVRVAFAAHRHALTPPAAERRNQKGERTALDEDSIFCRAANMYRLTTISCQLNLRVSERGSRRKTLSVGLHCVVCQKVVARSANFTVI